MSSKLTPIILINRFNILFKLFVLLYLLHSLLKLSRVVVNVLRIAPVSVVDVDERVVHVCGLMAEIGCRGVCCRQRRVD